jgi:hypothetical protein
MVLAIKIWAKSQNLQQMMMRRTASLGMCVARPSLHGLARVGPARGRWFSSSSAANDGIITKEELKQKLESNPEGFHLLDVRQPFELESLPAIHPRARLIPRTSHPPSSLGASVALVDLMIDTTQCKSCRGRWR